MKNGDLEIGKSDLEKSDVDGEGSIEELAEEGNNVGAEEPGRKWQVDDLISSILFILYFHTSGQFYL